MCIFYHFSPFAALASAAWCSPHSPHLPRYASGCCLLDTVIDVLPLCYVYQLHSNNSLDELSHRTAPHQVTQSKRQDWPNVRHHRHSAGESCEISHTRTVVRECCKGDNASQWRNPKFNPPPRSNPKSDSHKSWQRWLRRGPLVQKFVTIRPGVSFLRMRDFPHQKRVSF